MNHSNGLADQEYCAKMEKEVPITAQYLLDRQSTNDDTALHIR